MALSWIHNLDFILFFVSKKCDTLEEDFNKFIKVILNDLNTDDKRLTHKRYKQLQGYKDAPAPIFKLKYFRCKGMHKGNRFPFRFIFILDRKHDIRKSYI